jgi:ureidoacrylate peracid hydrolase
MTTVLSTLEAKVEPEHTAVLIIDMSNDFVHPQGKAATIGRRDVTAALGVIPVMQRLAAAARAAGVLVVHCQHTTLPNGASDSGPWLDARSRSTYSAPDIGLDGSWGQQNVDELHPEPTDAIVRKFRYGAFAGTDLELILRSTGRQTVVCCGVSTNVCVETTAREAFAREFYVVIPEDACASWDMSLHQAALQTARHRYATVTDTAALEALWTPAPDERNDHAR